MIAPLALSAATSQAAPSLDSGETTTYIVQLDDNPVAAYTGGTRGLTATKPGQGEKVDAESNAADAYEAHLTSDQDAALAAVGLGADDKMYEYTVAFNGFAAEMTSVQAAHMAKAPGVVNVWEEEIYQPDTITTPDYLGMTGEGGVWETQFGGNENAGSGMVIGMIDSGIWPENPSFGPLPAGTVIPPTFVGPCQTGEETDPARSFKCNNKVIGARYYTEGNTIIDEEFRSPRDFGGHGSHTSSTAAGNFGVDVQIGGADLGTASGMAPAAHIANYKVCWESAGCGGAGLVKAIDDATRDGVDVINYSISGSSTSIVNPIEIAFLNAASAGVFVSASAGNSGDANPSTVAHNAPWNMTVAASTHDRNVNKLVTLGPEDRVIRVKGLDPDKNRYGTAAEIARLYPDGVETVYVTTGETYYDALAAAPSASQGFAPTKGGEQTTADGEVQNTPTGDPAPILLVESDAAVPDITQTVLDEIGPTNIIILGGTGAVSQDVEDQLIAENEGEVTRIGGADRYVTAALLARDYGTSDKVFVATGETDGFGDALSGSALAGSEGVPVLLTKKDVAPGVVERTIEDLGATEIVFLGGENAISDDVYQQLGGTDRIFGKNRYETSAAIVAEFGYGEGNPAPFAHVATGENFADALTGSALAGFQDAPLVLTRQAAVPAGVLNSLKEIDPEQLYVLGGPVAVSEAAEAQLDAAFPGDETGPTYEGVGVGEAVGPAPLVYAGDAALPGVDPLAARECWFDADNDPSNGRQSTLDPAVIAGNIVICDRGTVARTDKSAAVAEADGIGMILANTSPGQSLNADFHSVPSIHVDSVAGAAIKAYEASAAEPTAFISADGQGEVTAPEMAGFSSVGPALAGGGDLLKPDITAPGVDVIAAVAPPGNGGEDFFSYSGTSMSSPHIAGLALLMAQDNPTWSPAAIKSAMMTTASPLNNMGEPIERGGEDADAFDYGSGEVEPGPAYGPGLVYDAGRFDWFEYGCAIGQFQFITAPGTCDAFTADASDLNSPSIAVGGLAGRQTVTRTVTNVGTSTVFTPQVEAPPGVEVVVTPAALTVAPGATATYEVLLTRTTAPLDEYTFGSLTWGGDAGHEVRSPIAVQPVGIAAPEEISGEGESGNQDVTVTPGFTGTLSTDVDGLVASDVEVVSPVSDGPAGGDDIEDGVRDITVPDGVDVLRVSIFDSEISVPGTDMDIFLINSDNQIVAFSAAGGSDESFTVEDPAPGAYTLAVDYWNGDTGETADVPTHLFLVTEADADNLTVTPESSSVIVGEDTTLNFAWAGLAPDSRYLGAVNYSDGTEEVGRTLVSITTGTTP
ncbi:hypothetical protein BH24ACT8_BH24ACT8_22540 [soil metagenome]